MRWTNLKVRVERFFAPSVKGRVELRAASYRKSHDGEGRGYITVDGTEVWNMDSWNYWRAEAPRVAAVADRTGLSPWEAQPIAGAELAADGELSQGSFYAALERYCDSPVEESLTSNDTLIRALAMLDLRVGKRRLAALDTTSEHPMVAYFHKLRMEAEGLGGRCIGLRRSPAEVRGQTPPDD